MKPEFDANEYFLRLCRENRLCRELQFRPCYCSGIGGMEGVMAQFQTTSSGVCRHTGIAISAATKVSTMAKMNGSGSQRCTSRTQNLIKSSMFSVQL